MNPKYLGTLLGAKRVKLGSELHPTDQTLVRAAYVHRFTGDHKPAWANDWKDGKPYPVQFKDDADWLANTFFAVKTNGRLSPKMKQCESHPTWPNNPELLFVAQRAHEQTRRRHELH